MNRMKAGIFLVVFLASCPGPVPPLQDPLAQEPDPAEVEHRILVYGDTRTGALLFENQANRGERIHEWVASQMMARLHGEKAEIVFTGDAVYAGGATFHYDNFVKAISPFKDAGLPFLPCMGNHELLAGIVGVISPWFESGPVPSDPSTQPYSTSELKFKQFIVDRHSEISKAWGDHRKLSQDTVSRLDRSSRELDSVIPSLETEAKSRSAAERILKGHHVMESIYVKRAGLSIPKNRTFYSYPFSPHVLGIMLDTNALDYLPQKEWLLDTLSKCTQELVIVFGHHPPLTIEGWDHDYMDLFRSHPKAVVWIMSHVHSFVYAFPESTLTLPARALFVSGGGGAPLVESDEKTVPIQGWKFGPPDDDSGQMFHFLDLRVTRHLLYVTVLGCHAYGEPMTPQATYTVRIPQ